MAEHQAGFGSAKAKLIANEKIKLRASYFNTLAGAAMTVGVAIPVAGFMFHTAVVVPFPGVIPWLLTSAGLHYMATLEVNDLEAE